MTPACVAAAFLPHGPASEMNPLGTPQTVPHVQWTRFEKDSLSFCPLGSTPSKSAAMSPGPMLGSRSLNFISICWERVTAAVPASPAKSPFPNAAATSASIKK